MEFLWQLFFAGEGKLYIEKPDEFTVVVDIANISNLKPFVDIRLTEPAIWFGIAQRVTEILSQVGCVDMLMGATIHFEPSCLLSKTYVVVKTLTPTSLTRYYSRL